MRIATSLVSVDQAKANLTREIPDGATFAGVRDRARSQWDGLLGRIEVEGASRDQLTTLYSNLYRLYLYPNSGFEQVGSRSRYASPFSPQTGQDTPTHTGSKIVDGEVYVNNGFWDTYRTTWPAYSLLTPKRAGKMVDGFVQQYKDGGWISRWSSPGYADLMTGTSSDVAFADAYVKGVEFDAEAAYAAAVKNATVAPPHPGVGRKGMTTSPSSAIRAPIPARACPGRWRATSTTSASPVWARRCTRRPKAPLQGRIGLFPEPRAELRQALRPPGRLLPGQGRPGQLAAAAGHLRPPGLGPRLHRDQRLDLRVHRTAGHPGPGQPLRRPGRPGQETGRLLLHPGDRVQGIRRLLRPGDP